MSQIKMFTTLDISASGLAAQRARMNVIAQNIANAGTTRTEAGGPYQRQEVVLEAVGPNGPATVASDELAPVATAGESDAAGGGSGPSGAGLITDQQREASLTPGTYGPGVAPLTNGVGGGVRVAEIRSDPAEFQRVYDPSHPDADAEGYVKQPNVNMVNEMVDMMMASRAYEANLAVMSASKDLLMRTLTIGKQ